MKNKTKDILAFRAIDFRERFKHPFATFTEALEALQSPKAFMGHTGKIVCYFTDSTEFTISSKFFTLTQPKFANKHQVIKWLNACKVNGEFPSFSFTSEECQLQIINEDEPLDAQLKKAMRMQEVTLVSQENNEQVAQTVYKLLAVIAPEHKYLSNQETLRGDK